MAAAADANFHDNPLSTRQNHLSKADFASLFAFGNRAYDAQAATKSGTVI